MLLDGALMLVHRRMNERTAGEVRFLMCDSSTQHNRDFEHIMWRSIKRGDLVFVHGAARELFNLWTPVHKVMSCMHVFCKFLYDQGPKASRP